MFRAILSGLIERGNNVYSSQRLSVKVCKRNDVYAPNKSAGTLPSASALRPATDVTVDGT